MDSLWRRPIVQLLLIGSILAAALVARAPHFTDPPLDFWSVRQYHSAIIARWGYLQSESGAPEWKVRVARRAAELRPTVEPRIVESLASGGYRLIGEEKLWLPRALSVFFWLSGGVILFFLARSMFSFQAAAFAAGYFLLAPFGVSASRSFQPDPLMVAVLTAALFAMLPHQKAPTPRTLAAAALLSGLAIYIKIVSAFFLLPVHFVLMRQRFGTVRAVFGRSSLIYLAIALLPAALYYGNGLFVSGFLRGTADNSLILDTHLWRTPAYWQNWLGIVREVVGFGALCAGLLGLIVCRRPEFRARLTALWGGYLAMGLIFPFAIHTHSYYSLPLIPIVALSIAALVDGIAPSLLTSVVSRKQQIAVALLFLMALRFSIYGSNDRLRVNSSLIPQFEHVGQLVKHSDKVMIAARYRNALAYHGFLVGVEWPMDRSVAFPWLAHDKLSGSEAVFQHKVVGKGFKYFVVEDSEECVKQPDLIPFLRSRFREAARVGDLLVFDLRQPVTAMPSSSTAR